MSKSLQLAVTTAAYFDVVVQTVCNRIVVVEDAGGQSTKTIFRGNPGDPDATLAEGVAIEFPHRWRPYQPGEIVGSIKAVAANATYAQIET